MSGRLERWLFFFLLIWTGCAPLRTHLDYERGLIAFQKGLYSEAQAHLQSALQRRPDDENTLSLQGWVFFKLGRTEEAQKYFKSANRINPKNISAIEGLAWIDYEEGFNEEAKNKFQQMISYAEEHFRNPYWPDYPSQDRLYIQSIYSNGHYGLGLIAKRAERLKEACQHLEASLKEPNQFISPDVIRSHLAEILFSLREYPLALIHYQDLLDGREADFTFLNRYAWCLYQTNKIQEAKSVFFKAKDLLTLTVAPSRGSSSVQNMTEKLFAKRVAETYYGLAIIHAKEGNLQEAMKELSIALSLSPFFHSPDELLRFLKPYLP